MAFLNPTFANKTKEELWEIASGLDIKCSERQRSIDYCNKLIDESAEEIRSQKQIIDDGAREIVHLRSEIEALQKKCTDAIADLKNKNDLLAATAAVHRMTSAGKLEERIATLENDNRSLEADRDALAILIQSKDQMIESLKKDIQGQRKAIESNDAFMKDCNLSMAMVEGEIALKNRTIENLNLKIESRDRIIDSKNEVLKSHADAIERQRATIVGLQHTRESQLRFIKKQSESIERMRKEISTLIFRVHDMSTFDDLYVGHPQSDRPDQSDRPKMLLSVLVNGREIGTLDLFHFQKKEES